MQALAPNFLEDKKLSGNSDNLKVKAFLYTLQNTRGVSKKIKDMIDVAKSGNRWSLKEMSADYQDIFAGYQTVPDK